MPSSHAQVTPLAPASHCVHLLPNTSSGAKRHGEAKLKWQSLEQRKLLQGQARAMGGSCFKTPHSLMARRGGKRLQATFGVRAGGLCGFPDPSAVKPQGHYMGILSSAWTYLPGGGGLSSCRRTQRSPYVHPLMKNQDPALITARLFPDYSSLSLYPLPSLISSYLKLPFGTQGRPGNLHEACSLQIRNEGRGKDL